MGKVSATDSLLQESAERLSLDNCHAELHFREGPQPELRHLAADPTGEKEADSELMSASFLRQQVFIACVWYPTLSGRSV
jgi:hypothetical protein